MDILLTPYQRLNLLNQYRILEQLARLNKDEDDALFYARHATIVSEGYSLDYGAFQADIADELPEDQARLVWDTLDMYAAIDCSYSHLRESSLTKDQIAFKGFDGNYEAELMNYCRFIIYDLNRFYELRENANDFNSHARKYKTYMAMVQKWKEMDRSYEMSEEQIKTLLEQ